MTNNKDLFKQAIAEAKSVREAAVANAKEALEETVTPHLKDMLATKLQEMDNDEEMYDEQHEIEDDSEQSDDEMEDQEKEEEVEDMSVKELKDLIRDVVAQEMGEEESEEEIDAEDMVDSEDEDEDEEEEEINLDELLSELDENEAGLPNDIVWTDDDPQTGGMNLMGRSIEDLDSYDTEVLGYSPSTGKAYKGMTSGEFGAVNYEDIEGVEEMNPRLTKNYIESLKKYDPDHYKNFTGDEVEEGSAYKMKSKKEGKMKKNEMEEGQFSGDQSDIAGAAGGLDNIIKAFEKLIKKGGKVGKKAKEELEKLAAANASVRGAEGSSFQGEGQLKEAVKTIKKLRTELNEVNVFNAKLLYLNKILKASNLKESQKVNIIAAFDNAETVKEAKLIYNTVCENTTNSKNKNSKILESRLGRASKATGTTAKRPETITESSQTVKRMQKLAGII